MTVYRGRFLSYFNLALPEPALARSSTEKHLHCSRAQ